MLLPHLDMLKYLTQELERRTILALHDRNLDAAWTNLMAATRLVTAWEPEPAEISRVVRFGDTSLAFNAIWQALQTHGWPDERLARLQTEWELVDFFTNLPETAAFKRASYVALCQQERRGLLDPLPTFTFFVTGAMQFPPFIWDELNRRWDQAKYSERGGCEDEKALLLFYRDRELELRDAVKAPTWSAMRQLPGVTNIPSFQSKYHSFMQSRLYTDEMHIQMRLRNEGSTLLGAAAIAEAQRRLIIAAIALERYGGRHGSFPSKLSELAPDFLKNPPVDFMDGQPLRYRSTDDGHFTLYSIGLDCVDRGGQMASRQWTTWADFGSLGALSKGDIVWPLPASTAAVEAFRVEEGKAQRQGGREYFRRRN
jgi:hypothetical protein